MTAWRRAGWILLFWAAVCFAAPKRLYVSPDGNDLAPGTLAAPLASIPAALERSRHDGISNLVLRGGVYALGAPLILGPPDSGLNVTAFENERPIISSQVRLRRWRRLWANPNIWWTTADFDFHELFVNGHRRLRTRRPETGFFHMDQPPVTNSPTEMRFHAGEIDADWAQAGGVELIAYQAWAQTRNEIRGVKSNVVTLAGNVAANGSERGWRYFLENVPGPLLPGQWHLDSHTHQVTYWPPAGEDVPSAVIVAPRLETLVRINGARDIVFRGLTFAETDWQLPGGNYVDMQAAFNLPAAFSAARAQGCTIDQCVFARLGGYAVEFGAGCASNVVSNSELFDLGGGGVRIGTPSADGGGGNSVFHDHIHDIGRVEAPAAGVLVLQSPGNRIARNEIDHTFYTAISVGWSWGYAPTDCAGNVVEWNHLHDIGQGMLSDMGGVYTLGVQHGAVVRNNVIHDVNIYRYGGWGLYTDEGSSGITLESNLVYRCQSAGFHQHYGETNILRHNIFALNREAQLARTRPESHLGFTFTSNIVYASGGALFSGNWGGHGYFFDKNIYYDTRPGGENVFRAWQKAGHDLHSIFSDPLFADPQRGNFRLRRGSPARRLGFDH